MAAGAWDGNHCHGVIAAVELAPQCPQCLAERGMYEIGGEIDHWFEHVWPAHEIGPGNDQSGLVADAVSVQQDVEVHGSRCPSRRAARTSALFFDGLQPFADAFDGIVSVEAHDEIDEVITLESDRLVAIRRLDAQRRIDALELC